MRICRTRTDLRSSAEQFVQDQISDREIDALLAFKSDARIDELRSALNRLEAGSYGYLSCMQESGGPGPSGCGSCAAVVRFV